MSEQKPSHEVEGIVRRAPREDCVEAQIWVPKMSVALKVSKNTVIFILKWKKELLRLFLKLAARIN
jgi:hypothetical protein